MTSNARTSDLQASDVPASDVQIGTITTQIPARLDRLPWARFHWRIVGGLGTVWILDGLEVTIVGSIGARLIQPGSGLSMTAAGIGLAAAIYVAGACGGALLFGQLTDRYGRKKLMMLTLSLYVVATVLTAFSFAPWYFFLCRFFTGAGIGGEYAAINSAIDELIPARNRGQVDITINGSYWVGSAIGGVAALFFLDTAIFPTDIGWRIAFAVGAVLGCGILLVRRGVPESPRWLFIHGRDAEAERIVDGIEAEVRSETQQEFPPPGKSITVRQRAAIPFREIAKVAIEFYPKRAVLGFALFLGQAFLYNAVTFNLGTMLGGFFGVSSGAVPTFMVIFAVGNFLGPFLLGRLFDTVGRVPMISGTYLGSAALTVLLAVLLVWGNLNAWTFIALVGGTFFLASAGASSAYLTVSEIFPMETRALAIAFFYALGTGVGGISGPLLFGNLIAGGRSLVAIGFLVGAVVMALGGVAELAFGVHAEGTELEDIAKPLTVADAERGQAAQPAQAVQPAPAQRQQPLPEERAAAQSRERAEEERARAAEHRASAHELRASAAPDDAHTAERAQAEEMLAQIAELRARALDEDAASHDQAAQAQAADGTTAQAAAQERAEAAKQRATMYAERAEALAAKDRAAADSHTELSEAAREQAEAHEQRALAAPARAAAAASPDGAVAGAEADTYDAWAQVHLALARAHEARADGKQQDADRAQQEAARGKEHALAAQDCVDAARHQAAARADQQQAGTLEQQERARTEAAERERMARQRDDRIRQRIEQREAREHSGLRRFRPGPGDQLYSPGMIGTASRWAPTSEQDLDREIESITRALDERGPLDRDALSQLVGAHYWGPGRFSAALHAAVDEGRIQHLARGRYGSARRTAAAG